MVTISSTRLLVLRKDVPMKAYDHSTVSCKVFLLMQHALNSPEKNTIKSTS